MSYITRRRISTLIPPKIATQSAIPPARLGRLVEVYEALPKGPAPKIKPRNPLEWYQRKYFDQNSAAPIYHAIAFLITIGYAQHYFFHLRDHKHNAQ